MKDVQKASPRPSSARPTLVALADAVHTALALTEPRVRERARLRCDLDRNVYVRGDPDRIAELFMNLLLNAAQAIPEGRSADNEIRVDLHELPGRSAAVVRVADTGNGIPPEVQERVFQPFFTTKPIGHGPGLGLAICQGIVTALGGEISFSSEPPRRDDLPGGLADDGGPPVRRRTPGRPDGTARRAVLFIGATLSSRLRCSRGSLPPRLRRQACLGSETAAPS